MAEDGEPPTSSRSRGNKGKHKRPPQRGLGVAQLERIRLEEQHKNSNAIAAASTSSSTSPPPSSSSSSQPLPLPSLNPIADFSSPPSFPNHPAETSGPRGFLTKWMMDLSTPDHTRPLGLISTRCPSTFTPRVINSMLSSPTSASGFCFHMEPPSSQIFNYHNNTSQSSSSSSSWQEEYDRNLVYRTGKRPFENMQDLSPYKIPSGSGSFVRAAHSPLVNYRNMVSRDCMPSCSSYQVDMEQRHAELHHVHQSKKENCLLTLGNRAPAPMRSDIWNQYQESVDDDNDTPSSYFGSSGPNTCSPYYTFLPLATDVQKEKDKDDCEETKSLDLNLKL